MAQSKQVLEMQNAGAYMHRMNWDDLKLFHAIVENGSMRSAAQALNISHSTISRRIDTLEKSVGTPLLLRLSDGLQVTEAGEKLIGIASDINTRLDRFDLHIASKERELSGTITLTMPDTIAVACLMPILSDFSALHPSIHLNVRDTIEIVDLDRREADIAFRFTNAPDPSLIGRKLATAYAATYASETYLDAHDPFASNSSARWVCDVDEKRQDEWLKASPFPDLKISQSVENPLIRKEALRSGMGIGTLPCALMINEENFVQLTDPEPKLDLWVLSHKDFRHTERMRVFRQYIFSRRDELASLLAGRPPLQS